MNESTDARPRIDEAAPRVGATVKRGYLWNLLSFGVSQGASLIIFIVMSRALTPATFGVFALAALMIDLVVEWGRWASTDAVIQRRDYASRTLSTVFFSLLGLTSLLAALFVFGAGRAAALLVEPELANVLPALAVTLLIMPGTAVMDSLILRQFNFRGHAIRSIIGMVAGGTAGLAVAFSPAFEWALVAQRLAASTAILTTLFFLTRWRPTLEFDPNTARDFVPRAAKLWAASVLATMHWRAAHASIGLRSGAAVLGLLTVAHRFETTLHGPLTGPIQSLWVPVLSALRGDRSESWRLYLRLTQITSLLVVPAFVGLSLVAHDLVSVVLDERYRLVADILVVVGLQGFTISVGYFSNLIFAGLDRTDLSLKVSAAQLSVTIPAVWIAAAYGPVWTQVVILITVGISRLIATIVQVKMLGGRLPELVGVLLPAYLSGLAMAAAVLLLKFALPLSPGILSLICHVGVGAATYAAWLLAFHRNEIIEAWRLISSIRAQSAN